MFTLILFVAYITIALELCPKDMDKLKLIQLSNYSNEEFLNYFYEGSINISEFEIHLEMEKDFGFASVKLSNNLNYFETDNIIKNSYEIELNEDIKKESFLRIKKCFEEKQICTRNTSPSKTKKRYMMQEDEKTESKITGYDIFIKINEIKIYSKNELIYEEKIEFKTFLGEYAYVQIRTNANAKDVSIRDLTICYIPSNQNKLLRNLQEGGEDSNGEIDSLEIDNYCLETPPNYLREGNTEIIASVKINPKDKNGNFPSSILNYTKIELKKLVKIEHSESAPLDWQITVSFLNQLVINLQTEYPGEIYLTSKYFKNINFDKYIIKIGYIGIDSKNIFAKLDEIEKEAGDIFKIQIYPMNKYGSSLAFIEKKDFEKFGVKAKLSNDSIINIEGGEFDPEEKAIIYNQSFTLPGEILFSVAYDGEDVSCLNCKIKVNPGEMDFNKSDIQYLELLEVGQISNLTIIPKDKYNNTIPVKEISEKLDIKCLFNNKTLKVISKIDEENNKLLFNHEDNITISGSLTWTILYNNNSADFIVKINAESEIKNSKFYLSVNSSIEEIKGNNTQINLDINSDFNLLIKLFDKYNNLVEIIDSANVSETLMYGNDMMPIKFNVTRTGNEFSLSIPENDREDFKYLVSGENYEIKIQMSKENSHEYFYFMINLTTPEDDEGYGNGPFNISHFTIEPNESEYEMFAGENYSIYLNLRTEKDLLYHRKLDIDLKEHLTYKLASEDKTFNFTVHNESLKLGIFVIDLFSTKSMENELTLIFDGIEIKDKKKLMIQPNWLPYPKNCEILNKTEIINEDLVPVVISIILRDKFNNEFINRKNIVYKKQLFIMVGEEKPEQNIELDSDNKTFILKYVSEKREDSLNLSIAFNDSDNNNLILIKNNIIVKYNIKVFCKPEELVVKVGYKPGKAFIYRNVKSLKFELEMEEQSSKEQKVSNNGDFLLYVRDKYYERGENNTKIAWYSGYLAIIDLKYSNDSDSEQYNYIHDFILINILNENNSNTNSYLPLPNNSDSDTMVFVKIDFYENGDIKNLYYPKSENFSILYMDIIKELASLIIPKISANLYSENIRDHLNEMLKELEEDNNSTDSKGNLLRRLSEISKKSKGNKGTEKQLKKIKKITYRVLQENSEENETETILEQELLPVEADVDINLRQIDKSSENSSELLLLSLQNVLSDKAKLLGSLDNKTVYTNITDDGLVKSVKENDQALFVNDSKDESQDEIVYQSYYSEDSLFTKEDWEIENETDSTGDLGYKNASLDTINSIDFLYDYSDENGFLIEYFSNVEYEEFNESFYENQLLIEMGEEFLNITNASNRTIISIEENIINATEADLRNLESRYPYYGQKVMNNIKDLLDNTILGLRIRKYVETNSYPDNGQTVMETIFTIGSFKYTVTRETSYSNNHIIIKNLNCLSNDLIELINEKIDYYKTYNNKNADSMNTYMSEISSLLVRKDYTNIFSDFIDYVKNFSSFYDTFNIVYDNITNMDEQITNFIKDFNEDKVEIFLTIRQNLKNEYSDYINLMINKYELFKNESLSFFSKSKNKIKDAEEIKNIQILYDLLNIIDECKNSFKNFNSTLFDNVNLKAETYILQFDSGDPIWGNSYENTVNTLIETIKRTVRNDFLLTKKSELISTLKYFKECNSNTTSTFISQLKEDFQNQISSSNKEEINMKLQNIYSEIESESDGFIEIINNKFKTFDYYNLIELYKNNLNYLSDAINKTLLEFYEDIDNTIYSKLSKIQPEYLVKSSKLMKIKEKLFDVAKNIITKSMRNSKEMIDEEISNYKSELEILLNNYSNILSDYLNQGILTELMNNFSISKNDFNFDNFENNLKMISENYNATYFLINRSSFLEYPQEIIDEINSVLSQSNDLLNNIEDIRYKINELIVEIFNHIYDKTKDYILNFILYHKNYVLSRLNDDSILFTIEGQKEKFEKNFELITNNTNSIIEELFPENLKDTSNNDISLREDNFINPISSLITNYGTFATKFENEVKKFFNGSYCPSDCWTEKNSTERQKYYINLNTDIINNKIFYTNSFLYNIKNKFDEMNENDFKELILPEPDLDFIKEDINYNKSFYELKDTISENYENISSDLYEKILY